MEGIPLRKFLKTLFEEIEELDVHPIPTGYLYIERKEFEELKKSYYETGKCRILRRA